MNSLLPTGTHPTENGWELYLNAPLFTHENVAGLMLDATSAEAVVVHYLASRMRRDERFQEVLAPTGNPARGELLERVQERQGLGLNTFQLVRRKDLKRERYYVKVLMDVQVNPERVKRLTDDVTVEKCEGRWCVMSAPL